MQTIEGYVPPSAEQSARRPVLAIALAVVGVIGVLAGALLLARGLGYGTATALVGGGAHTVELGAGDWQVFEVGTSTLDSRHVIVTTGAGQPVPIWHGSHVRMTLGGAEAWGFNEFRVSQDGTYVVRFDAASETKVLVAPVASMLVLRAVVGAAVLFVGLLLLVTGILLFVRARRRRGMPAEEPDRRSVALWAGLVLSLTGVAVVLTGVTIAAATTAGQLLPLDEVPLPGRATVQLEAGSHVLYGADRASTVSRKIRVTDPRGQEVVVDDHFSVGWTTLAGREHRVVARFEAVDAGPYRIETTGAGPEVLLLGPPASDLEDRLVRGVAIAGTGLAVVTVGLVTLLVAALLRARRRRRYRQLDDTPAAPRRSRLLPVGLRVVAAGVVGAVVSGWLLSAGMPPSPSARPQVDVPGAGRLEVVDDGAHVVYVRERPTPPGEPLLRPPPARPDQVRVTGPGGAVLTVAGAYAPPLFNVGGSYRAVAQFRAPSAGWYEIRIDGVEPSQAIVAPETSSLTLRSAVGFLVAALTVMLFVVGVPLVIIGLAGALVRAVRGRGGKNTPDRRASPA